MTDDQWTLLKGIINGENTGMQCGFIIDSPWLPNWYGTTILNYFTNDNLWMESNLKVLDNFPDTIFLPGFWSEYGMCTEPSAFGARCTFPENEFPHAHKVILSAEDIDKLAQPNPRTDGLLPFVINRLKLNQQKIENAGHNIRFAVARGPLNIASYLMGSTEFLTTMMMQPEKAHLLIKKITDFLMTWLDLQIQTFPSIDGILLLDDIIGFLGKDQFLEFAFPYFQKLYNFDISVKFLHNDAPCLVSASYLADMGVNLFNMGFDIDLNELKILTKNKITLLGNLPPRDVLANGTAEQIYDETKNLLISLNDKSRVILSCGGGMPPGVSTENLHSFIDAVKDNVA